MSRNPLEPLPDEPFTGPSEWYKYRCHSCSYEDWVEDIVVDAFPPLEPGGFGAIVCPKCSGSFRCDTTEPTKRSYQHPDQLT